MLEEEQSAAAGAGAASATRAAMPATRRKRREAKSGASLLAVVQTGGGELPPERGSRHESDEGPRLRGRGGPHRQRRGIGSNLLEIARKRSHELHALDGQDLADLVHAEIG